MAADPDYKANLTTHKASNYNTHASFVYSAQNTAPVLELLKAQPGEKIIDLGCGTGNLTQVILDTVGQSGQVWGVDSSGDMLEKARAKTNSRITYVQGDIQNLIPSLDPSLKGTFDAVFSSATFHWCKANPGGVIEGIKWLLKPGGRLAFEMGGFGNTVGVRSAIHQVLRKRGLDPIALDPWYFPTVKQYAALLEKHGMTPRSLTLVPRPTPLDTDIRGWLDTFARGSFLAHMPIDEQDSILDEVAEICRIDCFWSMDNPGMGVAPPGQTANDEQGWEIMYVRLRGVAYIS